MTTPYFSEIQIASRVIISNHIFITGYHTYKIHSYNDAFASKYLIKASEDTKFLSITDFLILIIN